MVTTSTPDVSAYTEPKDRETEMSYDLILHARMLRTRMCIRLNRAVVIGHAVRRHSRSGVRAGLVFFPSSPRHRSEFAFKCPTEGFLTSIRRALFSFLKCSLFMCVWSILGNLVYVNFTLKLETRTLKRGPVSFRASGMLTRAGG